jgi:hypothetical protein
VRRSDRVRHRSSSVAQHRSQPLSAELVSPIPREIRSCIKEWQDRTQTRGSPTALGGGRRRSSRVQWPQRNAESPRITRSSNPKSRAAATIVSAPVVIRRPSTVSTGTGRGCRHTRRPVRSGYRSPIGTAAKTGWIASGSHQPLTSAAVSEVNAALFGSTSR